MADTKPTVDDAEKGLLPSTTSLPRFARGPATRFQLPRWFRPGAPAPPSPGRFAERRPAPPLWRRLLWAAAVLLILVSLVVTGVVVVRALRGGGSGEGGGWREGTGKVDPPKEAWPWECRKGLWSCHGVDLNR